ncbi:MAG TPA: hypothetical protein VF105_05780 [Gemmatimonadaceae bacterium]
MAQLRQILLLLSSVAFVASSAAAQTPAKDPSERLRQVLPADVAARVLSRIAEARARQLPAEALQNRALKFAAKGVNPTDIERSINEQLQRMEVARNALVAGRGSAANDEIEAGAEAMRKGVDGSLVSALAKTAPHDRSLAVPLFVISSLMDRGLAPRQALERVLNRLEQRASDADLEGLPGELPSQAVAGQSHRPTQAGERGSSGRSGVSGRPPTAGPPFGVPGNGGSKTNPGQSHRPPKSN